MSASVIETNDQLADLTDMIRDCAGSVGYKYRGFVEVDDLVQEGWVWALENRHDIDMFLDAGQVRLVRHKLNRAMQQYARRERAAWLRISPDDEFFYSVSMLREMLPLVLPSEGPAPHTTHDEGASRGTSAAESGNWEAAWVDIRTAFKRLHEHDRYMVWRTFVDEAPSYVIGREIGLTAGAVRSRVTRALKRIQKNLGGPKP